MHITGAEISSSLSTDIEDHPLINDMTHFVKVHGIDDFVESIFLVACG